MGPFRGPYRGSPLRDPCWWAVTTEVAAHWEEVLMGPFRGGTHNGETMSWLQKPTKYIQMFLPYWCSSICSRSLLAPAPNPSYLDEV